MVELVNQPGTPDAPPVSAMNWEGVYREHFKAVWRFLARLGIRAGDLEDVAQDVFLTAFKRGSFFDPTRPVLPWLYGIAFRVASARKRLVSSTREESTDILPELAFPESTAEAAVAKRQARAILDQVLASIDLEKRAVFVMYEFDGMTVPDIARAVDVPVPTAHSRLRLARQQFNAGIQRLRAKANHDPRA
jgi:RNA polymerase sigma-70 factor, ECF subfamily